MVVSIAVVNENDLTVAGIEALLEPYTHRVRLVDQDDAARTGAGVDVVLSGPLPEPAGPPLAAFGSSGRPRLVVLGWEVAPSLVRTAIGTEVDGYIFKGSPAEVFVDAAERVCRGERVMPPAGGDPVHGLPPGRWPGDEFGLSVRESEVIAMICQGLSNQEIAERVFISINTVKTYIRSGYRKIDAKTRPQAVIWGLANGLAKSSSPTPPSTAVPPPGNNVPGPASATS